MKPIRGACRKPALAVLVFLALLAMGCQRRAAPLAPLEPSAASAASAASVPAPASAAASVAAAPVLPSLGAMLARSGAPQVPACSGCHGLQGEGQAAAGFPRIAGQPAAYLANQLDAYADGRRRHPVMAPVAQAMSAEQRRAGAAYYASLSPAAALPAASAAAAASGGRGAELALRGDEALGVQACANCHGSEGVGGAGVPYLAAQHPSSLTSFLAAWADGSRNTDASGQMPRIAKALRESDVRAVAAYYAARPPAAAPLDAPRAAAPAGPASAAAVTSAPRPAGGPGQQGVGSEQGAPLTGGTQGPAAASAPG